MDISAMSSQFAEHEDKWVAINETDNTIVATGDSIFDVDREAEQKGYDNVLLFKVPRFDVGFIP
ncbi:MAG: DUF5678 domain-containing protein [Acidobacteriota bacterium]